MEAHAGAGGADPGTGRPGQKLAVIAAGGVRRHRPRAGTRPARGRRTRRRAGPGEEPAGQEPAAKSRCSAPMGPLPRTSRRAGAARGDLLPVLPDRWAGTGSGRWPGRAAGRGRRAGLTPGARYPLAGLLLARRRWTDRPAGLRPHGVRAAAERVYGLEPMLVMLVSRRCCVSRAPRVPPHRHPGAGPGAGLDGPPKLATPQLGELAARQGRGPADGDRPPPRRGARRAGQYTTGTPGRIGTRDVQKMHAARLKSPPRARRNRVTDGAGDPR